MSMLNLKRRVGARALVGLGRTTVLRDVAHRRGTRRVRRRQWVAWIDPRL